MARRGQLAPSYDCRQPGRHNDHPFGSRSGAGLQPEPTPDVWRVICSRIVGSLAQQQSAGLWTRRSRGRTDTPSQHPRAGKRGRHLQHAGSGGSTRVDVHAVPEQPKTISCEQKDCVQPTASVSPKSGCTITGLCRSIFAPPTCSGARHSRLRKVAGAETEPVASGVPSRRRRRRSNRLPSARGSASRLVTASVSKTEERRALRVQLAPLPPLQVDSVTGACMSPKHTAQVRILFDLPATAGSPKR